MLNPLYISTQDIDSYLVDPSSGLPLANGVVTFFQDSQRTVMQPVWQLTGSPPYDPITSYVQLPNPIILSNVGTYQDASGNNVDVLYYPYVNGQSSLYYITIQDSAGNIVATREAWPPAAVSVAPSPTASANFTENQISNPTFTNVFLNPGIANVYSASAAVNQVFPLGPDWDFIISGTGNVTVSQVAVAGVTGIPSSPAYVLDVSVGGGITSCFLRQRFAPNSGLWATVGSQDIYLTGSFVAQNQSGGTVDLSMYYTTSAAEFTSSILIFTGTVSTIYQFLSGGTSSSIPVSTDVNIAGFVEIYLSFPLNSEIRVSSIQLIPSLTASTSVLAPDLNSSNRNEAYQGDYYIPRNNAKPTGSFLTGWDFTLNPFQFGTGGSFLPSTSPVYIVDQTIVQTSAAGSGTWAIDSTTDGLKLTGVGSGSICILQYLSNSQVQKMLGTKLSVNVFGYQTASTSSRITMQIYLFTAPTTISTPPAIPILPSSIGTLGSGGIFTLSGAAIANGWTEIPRFGLPNPQVVLNNVSSSASLINNFDANNYGFNGWQIPVNGTNDANYFAMVVTFTNAGAFTINSISLVPGDIPCRPLIQTPTEVLLECQYYYQKSFIGSQPPVQNLGVNTGESFGIQATTASTAGGGPLIRFPVTMRPTSNPSGGGPNVTLYNPAVGGVSGMIRNSSTSADWTGSVPTGLTPQGFATFGTSPGGSAAGNFSAVHWTADARLGVV